MLECCNKTVLKDRKITLHKSRIFKDIEDLTMKLADTSLADQTVETKDAVAADVEEGLDGGVLAAFAEERDTRLRVKLDFCLRPELIYEIDNTLELEPDFVFNLALPMSFQDKHLKTAAVMMHEYMVKAVLFDWYRHIGSAYGNFLAQEVEDLERKIVMAFDTPGFVKRPREPYITFTRR